MTEGFGEGRCAQIRKCRRILWRGATDSDLRIAVRHGLHSSAESKWPLAPVFGYSETESARGFLDAGHAQLAKLFDGADAYRSLDAGLFEKRQFARLILLQPAPHRERGGSLALGDESGALLPGGADHETVLRDQSAFQQPLVDDHR